MARSFVVAWAWLDGREVAAVCSAAASKASGTVTGAAPLAPRSTTAVTDPAVTLARLFSAASLPFASAVGDAAVPEAVAAAARGALVMVRYDVLEATAAQRGPVQNLGEDAPVADNASAEGRAQNRRTEVRFEGVRVAAR